MNEKVIFNFGLLFEENFSNELIQISKSFEAEKKLDYALGSDSLPHVTILQFPGLISDAEIYWNRLLGVTSLPTIKLHIHGLAFDRFRTWDGIWARIKPCQEIRDVQKIALSTLGPLEYVNGLGNFYEPHATLAAWPMEERLPNFRIPDAAINRRDIPTYYSLGISGPNFQYQRCLFRKTISARQF